MFMVLLGKDDSWAPKHDDQLDNVNISKCVTLDIFLYKQEQYEKVMENMQGWMDDMETKLKAVRLMLQEKVNQLKEQVGP